MRPAGRRNHVGDLPRFDLGHIECGQGGGKYCRRDRLLGDVDLLVGGSNTGIAKARFSHVDHDLPVYIAESIVAPSSQRPRRSTHGDIFNRCQRVVKISHFITGVTGQGDRGLCIVRGQLGGICHVDHDNRADRLIPRQEVGGNRFAQGHRRPVFRVAQALGNVAVAADEDGRVDVGGVVKATLPGSVHLLDGRRANIGRHRTHCGGCTVGGRGLLPVYAMLIVSHGHSKKPPFLRCA